MYKLTLVWYIIHFSKNKYILIFLLVSWFKNVLDMCNGKREKYQVRKAFFCCCFFLQQAFTLNIRNFPPRLHKWDSLSSGQTDEKFFYQKKE